MGFAGLQRRHEALLIDPHLPPDWKRVRVPLWFRGARAEFDLRRSKHADHVGITVERAALTVLLDGEERVFSPGRHRLRRSDGGLWEVVVK
jgi:trehalose/maltose hydrolase-like predicted phosphorylase